MSKIPITFCVVAIMYIASVNGADCTWCAADLVQTCAASSSGYGITDIQGWTLVRAIGANKGTWFANTDNLMGTDGAADNGANIYNIGPFEAAVSGYNQMLFVSGDCNHWLITSKGAAQATTGLFGAQATICSSSISDAPYQALQFNRGGIFAEDPWISVKEHWSAIWSNDLMYAEANTLWHFPQIAAAQGRYVYIRKVEDAQCDGYGCGSPVPHCCNSLQRTGRQAEECEEYLDEYHCTIAVNRKGQVCEWILCSDVGECHNNNGGDTRRCTSKTTEIECEAVSQCDWTSTHSKGHNMKNIENVQAVQGVLSGGTASLYNYNDFGVLLIILSILLVFGVYGIYKHCSKVSKDVKTETADNYGSV